MAKVACVAGVGQGSSLLLFAQGAMALVLITGLALTPPRVGPMMIVPLSSDPVKPWLDTQRDVTILGIGTIAGSLVVSADRNALLPVAASHRAFLLPALPLLCVQKPRPEEIEIGRSVA